jgi:hypothetical protein
VIDVIETLNRTAKLALDDGSAASIEEAMDRFKSFNLQIAVGDDVAGSPALQAALVTMLNAAPRTFLGIVSVVGNLDTVLQIGWFRCQTVRSVAAVFGVTAVDAVQFHPTVKIGQVDLAVEPPFAINLACDQRGFRLSPEPIDSFPNAANIPAGVAAAGAALNEAFHFTYFHRGWAGQRDIAFVLPPRASATLRLPESLWFIGLGHLGQAMMWTMGLGQVDGAPSPRLRLQDNDAITQASLSTGLLTKQAHIGKLKVDIVADEMSLLGFACERLTTRVDLSNGPIRTSDTCLVSVDSFNFRRQLDQVQSPSTIEGGIGDGLAGFTRLQIHRFPGIRKAADVWIGADPKATRPISVEAPAYQKLIYESGDGCGIAQLAGRSVATPFIGAFAGAFMYAVLAGGDMCDADTFTLDVSHLP